MDFCARCSTLLCTLGMARFAIPQDVAFQGPNSAGAESVKGFMMFVENSILSNKYPNWWLKTLPVKSFKLACDGWAQSMAAQKELVLEALKTYSPSINAEQHTFLEQWVGEGKNRNEIAFLISGMFAVATDTVS